MPTLAAKLLLILICLSLSACYAPPERPFRDNGYLGDYDPAREGRIKEIEETIWMQPPEVQRLLQYELDYLKRLRNFPVKPSYQQDFLFDE